MEALQIKINKWTISDDTLVVGGLEDNEVRGTWEDEWRVFVFHTCFKNNWVTSWNIQRVNILQFSSKY